MPRIFISYRRSDGRDAAVALSFCLEKAFGDPNVFYDEKDIQAGTEWTTSIDENLNRADYLLVVIGPGWLEAKDDNGDIRLHDPEDVHRAEIRTALHRRDIVVMAVLVKGAPVPDVHDLPEDIRQLFDRQAFTVQNLARDCERLVALLQGHEARHNLPEYRTSFVGRRVDLEGVATALREERLVTISGPGGTGKSRLAVELCMRLAAEEHTTIVYVGLASLARNKATAGFVAAEVLKAIHESQPPSASALERAIEVLVDQRLVVLLDNCEHVIDGVAKFADCVIRECSAVAILTTSREPLRIDGERVWSLSPLSLAEDVSGAEALLASEAARVFVDRAGRIDHTFTATDENARLIGHICRLVEGIPLAIELAAARIETFSLREVARRLEGVIELPEPTLREAEPRQSSMEATIDWSYQLLPLPQRVLFARLAAFKETFSLTAAERIAADEDLPANLVTPLLARLVEQCLVIRAGERYRLLWPVRAFASSKLVEAGEYEAVAMRHAQYFVDLVEAAEPELEDPSKTLGRELLTEEVANLRMALEFLLARGGGELAQRLAGGLLWYWYWTGSFTDGLAYLEQAAASDDTKTEALAKTLYGAGVLSDLVGSYRSGEQHLIRAAAVSKALGLEAQLARSLTAIGVMKRDQGLLRQALTRLRQAEEIARRHPRRAGLGITLRFMGKVKYLSGDVAAGKADLDEALRMFERSGSAGGQAWVLADLGDLMLRLGNVGAALAAQERALAFARSIGEARGIAWALFHASRSAWVAGERGRSEEYLAEALELFPAKGDLRGMGWAALLGAEHAAELGDTVSARTQSLAALGTMRRIGDRRGLAGVAMCLGALAEVETDDGEAIRRYGMALDLYREAGDRWGLAEALMAVASMAARGDDVRSAARVGGCAAALRDALDPIGTHPSAPTDAFEAGALRCSLTAEDLDDCWRAGRRLSLDEAVDLARSLAHTGGDDRS